MKDVRDSLDNVGSEKLSKTITGAIGKIELVIETKRSSKIFYFRATRELCEMGVKWRPLIALFASLGAIIVGIRRFWS